MELIVGILTGGFLYGRNNDCERVHGGDGTHAHSAGNNDPHVGNVPFFPTVGEEYGSITDAMRMRGIRFGGGKPAKMLEYRMVPLMISCVKIGDELSAAALTRGLGAPVKRTNICKIGFGAWDFFALLLCAAAPAAETPR